MFSWKKLNKIIETRMSVPLNMDLKAMDETEFEEIVFYDQIKDEDFPSVDWLNDDLQSATLRYKDCLMKKYPELSEESANKLANRIAYSWWK